MTKLCAYSAFALAAILANLTVQRLVLRLPGLEDGLLLAMIAGTAAGLVLKYSLDKRWIFADHSQGLAAHGRRFGLYTLMGGVTTLLFWLSEYLFWRVFGTQTMRELGAILGLICGYVLKYHLDHRFVFTPSGKTA